MSDNYDEDDDENYDDVDIDKILAEEDDGDEALSGRSSGMSSELLEETLKKGRTSIERMITETKEDYDDVSDEKLGDIINKPDIEEESESKINESITLPTKSTHLHHSSSSSTDMKKYQEQQVSFLLNPASNISLISPLEQKRRLRKMSGARPRTQSMLREQLYSAKQAASGCGIVRLDKLGNISKTLDKNSNDRHRGPGLPTAICIHSKFIAIGTSRSTILVFDHFQEQKNILGSAAESDIDGPVTALDIAPHCLFLISGYSSGKVVLWDIDKGGVLKAIADAHHKPITAVSFWKDAGGPLNVISVDLGGIINSISFSKIMMWWQADIQCVLNGSGGQMVALTVLDSPPPACAATALYKSPLIALSSYNCTFIIQLEPSASILFKWPKPEGCLETEMPCISWNWACVHLASNKGKEHLIPVLARGWGKHVQLLTTQTKESSGLSSSPFAVLDTMSSTSSVKAIDWLTDRILVYLNEEDEISIFDTVLLEELETVQVKEFKFVYHTLDNVISASAPSSSLVSSAEERRDRAKAPISYQNSFKANLGRLYMLGIKEVRIARVQEWTERINSLVDTGEWLEALALSLDHYEASLSLLDPRHPTRISGIEILQKLLMKYVNIAFNKEPTADAKNHYQTVGGVCVEFCVISGGTSLLFGPIFEKFRNSKQLSIFLDLLEPYILNDKLRHLNPEVMQCFVEHYRSCGMLRQVEQCLVHLDTRLMDLDGVVKLCKVHRLYSALIYVFNKGLDDYLTPIDILLAAMGDTKDIPISERQNSEYQLLLYLSLCLSGRAFPSGSLHVARAPSVRAEVLEYLFAEVKDKSKDSDKILKLLASNISELLRILSHVLDSDDVYFADDADVEEIMKKRRESTVINTTNDTNESVDSSLLNFWLERNMICPSRHFMIDRICKIVFSHLFTTSTSSPTTLKAFAIKNNTSQVNLEPEDEGQLLQFLAKYICQGCCVVPPPLFTRIINFLVNADAASLGSSSPLGDGTFVKSDNTRQNLLVCLLEDESLDYHVDEKKLLPLVEKAGYYKAAVSIHKRNKNFHGVMESYLSTTYDKPFQRQLFDYIVARSTNGSNEEKEETRRLALEYLPKLLTIDRNETAKLIVMLFANKTDEVLAKLESDPRLQFDYLQQIMMSGSTGNENNDMAELLIKSGMKVTAEMRELYIKLLCQFEPEKVFSYLSSRDDYRLDPCLKLCQLYGITDATAFLLERTGDVNGALDLIVNALDSKLSQLEVCVNNNSNNEAACNISIQSIINMAVSLCKRHSVRGGSGGNLPLNKVDETSDRLWFSLLDRFVRSQRVRGNNGTVISPTVAAKNKMHKYITSFIQTILNVMTNFVTQQKVWNKIQEDHNSDEFGDFRNTICNMLDTYHYEQNILRTANHLFSDDMYRSVKMFHTGKGKPLRLPYESCSLCQRRLRDGSGNEGRVLVIAFGCGHAYHDNCINRAQLCMLCQNIKYDSGSRRESGAGVDLVAEKGKKAAVKEEVKTTNQSNNVYIKRLELSDKRKKKGNKKSVQTIFDSLFNATSNNNAAFTLSLAPPLEDVETKIGEREVGSLPAEASHQKSKDEVNF